MFYLTKYIIADYLERNNIKVKFFGKVDWKFSDVELYSDLEFSSDTLYFINNDTPFYLTNHFCTIRLLESDIFDSYSSRDEEIVCYIDNDNINVYQELLSCFHLYKNWYLKLLECLINEKNLQTLLDCSLPIFRNPIAVSDIGFQVLAYTKEYYSQMDDAESKFIVKNGCHSPEYIQLITQNTSFIENLRNKLGPFHYHYDFLQHESVYCTIWLHNNPVGFLTVVGMNHLNHQAVIDAAQLFAEILSKAFELSSSIVMQNRPTDHLLLQILNGQATDIELIHDVLKKTGLYKDGIYSIIYINMPFIKSDKNLLYKKVFDVLTQKLLHSKLLFDISGITIIHSQKDLPPKQIVQIVDLLLLSYHYQIGVSYSFQGLQNLNPFYRQARICTNIKKLTINQNLYYYETLMIHDLLHNELNYEQKQAAIHPALRILRLFDSNNSTNLYNTLYYYLKTNGNGIIAAQKLHIHKNTLYYRMNQIKQLTHLDLDDISIYDCLRISYYLSDIFSE